VGAAAIGVTLVAGSPGEPTGIAAANRPPGDLEDPLEPTPARLASVAIGAYTPAIAAGGRASVRAMMAPGARCGIVFRYGPGPAWAAGLDETADDRGIVVWSWVVDPVTPRGTWPVIVT